MQRKFGAIVVHFDEQHFFKNLLTNTRFSAIILLVKNKNLAYQKKKTKGRKKMFAVLETFLNDHTLNELRFVGVPCTSYEEARELMNMHIAGKVYEVRNSILPVIEWTSDTYARIIDFYNDAILYKCYIVKLTSFEN